MKRWVVVAFVAVALSWLGFINVHLYRPGRVERAFAQVRFLELSLAQGGAERMQALFPEGYVFTWALEGLAAAQVARALPAADPRRQEALRVAREAMSHVDSDRARRTFTADMDPAYGAFYRSWSLYLRGCLMRAGGPARPTPFELGVFERDCDDFAAALARSDQPWLPSYPGSVWPADTAPGVAALAIADSLFAGRYRPVLARWIDAVRLSLDPDRGAIPHAADFVHAKVLGEPRGESLALVSLLLAEVDGTLARRQYEILRRDFVDYAWGVPGVREYPRGVRGRGDVDSGPLVLGFSGPAIVVGAGAALANGDEELGTTLLSVAELAGLPIEIAGRRAYAGGILPVGDAFLAWARSVPAGKPRSGFTPLVPRGWRIPFHLLSIAAGALLIRAASRAMRTREPSGEPVRAAGATKD